VDDVTVAGMPLAGENDIMQPLAAVVCLKGLDEAGNVCYWSRATDGLSTTEALGMALGLLDDIRDARGAAYEP
jgi:hypothetical protein